MTTLVCCHTECSDDATFGILGEGQTPDLETHACDAHLSALLEPGVSTVWPIIQIPRSTEPHGGETAAEAEAEAAHFAGHPWARRP